MNAPFVSMLNVLVIVGNIFAACFRGRLWHPQFWWWALNQNGAFAVVLAGEEFG